MISGMHVAINTSDPEAVRAFLRDNLGIPCYDAGGGFLIFEPAAAEIGCGSADDTPFDLYFFCDDIEATVKELEGRGVAFVSPIREEDLGQGNRVCAARRSLGRAVRTEVFQGEACPADLSADITIATGKYPITV